MAVLDYGMGNLRSVLNAFRVAGAESVLVSDPAGLDGFDALVFPGQGCIVDCVRQLRKTGLDAAIADWVDRDRPFFGICLGLQALFDHSEEGDGPGLSIIPGEVRRFRLPDGYKVPHMGWNRVRFSPENPLAEGIDASEDQFYFVHSYYVVPENRTIVWCESDYGGAFWAGIRRGRCYARKKARQRGSAFTGIFLSAWFSIQHGPRVDGSEYP